MRIPGQFNNPPPFITTPDMPDWFHRYMGKHSAALRRLSQCLTGPTSVVLGALGATNTVKFVLGDLITGTLDTNTTLTLDIETRAGAEGLLELTQDATGGRTVAWVNALTTPAISATANKKTLIGATYNGTGWVLRTLASGY